MPGEIPQPGSGRWASRPSFAFPNPARLTMR